MKKMTAEDRQACHDRIAAAQEQLEKLTQTEVRLRENAAKARENFALIITLNQAMLRLDDQLPEASQVN